jgi:hypothetical protein
VKDKAHLAALPLRWWIVPMDGFQDFVARAPAKSQATWATFSAAQAAGYYTAPDGFSRFLAHVGHVREITAGEAATILGHQSPIEWRSPDSGFLPA